MKNGYRVLLCQLALVLLAACGGPSDSVLEEQGCDSCHGCPPSGGLHLLHAAVEAMGCEACHGAEPGTADWHDEGHGLVEPSLVDIRSPWESGMEAPPGQPGGEYWGEGATYRGGELPARGGSGGWSCAGLQCHGGGEVGLEGGPQPCGDCHGYPPDSGAHAAHARTVLGGCAACHGPEPGRSDWHNQGWGVPWDFRVDMRAPWGDASGTAYAGSGPDGWGEGALYCGQVLPAAGDSAGWLCAGLQCHGGATVEAAAPAEVTCSQCHDATPASFTASRVLQAADHYSAWCLSTDLDHYGGHGDPDVIPAGAMECGDCHDLQLSHRFGEEVPSNPLRLQQPYLDGAAELNLACTSIECHRGPAHTHTVEGVAGSLKALKVPGDVLPLYPRVTVSGYTNTAGDRMVCITCHDPHGVPVPPAGDQRWMLRITWDNSLVCIQCH